MAQTVIEEQGIHPGCVSAFLHPKVIKAEEERFLATLERGLTRLDQAIQDMGQGRCCPGHRLSAA